MKKVLVFMIVLGLVSSANASVVTFKAGGSSGTVEVLAGATVTVTVVADVATLSSYTLNIMESYSGNATGHLSVGTTVGTVNAGFNFNVQNGTAENAMTNSGGTYTPRYILIDRINGGMSPAGNIAAGSALYTFTIVIPSDAAISSTWLIGAAVPSSPYITPPATAYSHKIDTVTVATNNPVTLHVIPEPMTIALLGLGGLFLRRRKQ